MRIWLRIALLGLLLNACTVVSEAPLPTAVVMPTDRPTSTRPSPTGTETSLLPSPTVFPSATSLPTETPTFTPLPSPTPTATSAGFVYVFPLQPASVAGFAEGTASHGYPATDIFAPRGTKFVAVTNGVVDFVSRLDRWDPAQPDMSVAGGLCVAIVGDDGVRYYGSHLEAVADGIEPGVRVSAGQLLGLVGNTGNAAGKDTHLHFGISRPSTPDDWKARRGQVDPYPFLLAWKQGIHVTPPLPAPEQ